RRDRAAAAAHGAELEPARLRHDGSRKRGGGMTTVAQVERRDAIDAFAVGTMVLLTFSWGLNQVLIKVANTGYNPVFLTFGRSALAALLVYAWCRWRGIRIFEKDGTLAAGILAGVLFGAEFVLI